MRPDVASAALTHAPGHQPERTCVGCRGRDARSVLVRVVLSDGRLMVDASASMPGRGAWLHPGMQCLAQAMKRKAIGRALRATDADGSALAEHEAFAAS